MIKGIFGFFTNPARRYVAYGFILMTITMSGMVAYIKILRLERDAAVSESDSAQKILEAVQRSRKAEIDALEQARKEDVERFKFSENTKKSLRKSADNAPLSVNQRLIADSVRQRYVARAHSKYTGKPF